MTDDVKDRKRAYRTPTGLQTRGKGLWRTVVGAGYVFRPDELYLLEEACIAADNVARLEAESAQGGELLVEGSTGQTRVDPLLVEARLQRTLVAKLIGQLNLPDPEDDDEDAPVNQQTRAVRARWNRRDALVRAELGRN
jgi:hypothetical protein